MIVVTNSHGIHGGSKEFFRRHHVGKVLWIQLVSLGRNIVNIKILSSLDPRTSLKLFSAVPIHKKPRSIYKLGCAMGVKRILDGNASLACEVQGGSRHCYQGRSNVRFRRVKAKGSCGSDGERQHNHAAQPVHVRHGGKQRRLKVTCGEWRVSARQPSKLSLLCQWKLISHLCNLDLSSSALRTRYSHSALGVLRTNVPIDQ